MSIALPQLYFIGLNMSKMDGKQGLKELKKHPLYKKIPVIVFSTKKNETEINLCYELGANTYVVKPTTYDHLLQTIDVINSYWLKTAAIAEVKAA